MPLAVGCPSPQGADCSLRGPEGSQADQIWAVRCWDLGVCVCVCVCVCGVAGAACALRAWWEGEQADGAAPSHVWGQQVAQVGMHSGRWDVPGLAALTHLGTGGHVQEWTAVKTPPWSLPHSAGGAGFAPSLFPGSGFCWKSKCPVCSFWRPSEAWARQGAGDRPQVTRPRLLGIVLPPSP